MPTLPKTTTPSAPPIVIDRKLYRTRRERAARVFSEHDFLHRRVIADIVDRLETVTRQFETAAFFGAAGLETMLTEKAGVRRVISVDLAQSHLGHAHLGDHGGNSETATRLRLVADDEAPPFAPASLDLIVSLLLLHQTNDLVGALAQYRQALKPDGLLIAALFAEDTLSSLRGALRTAETQADGRVAPRVLPFASVRDLGAALQRAGFALPVADIDRIQVAYSDPKRLIDDLRGMGETNSLMKRGGALSRAAAAQALAMLQTETPEIGFDIVTLTGWAPAASQQQPLKPGSAKTSLADAVNRRKS